MNGVDHQPQLARWLFFPRWRFGAPMTPPSLSANAVVDYYKGVGFDG
jgi:hypothetical protein